MPSRLNRIIVLASLTVCSASAADRHWDGGTVNIATNGNGSSGGTPGNWDTSLTNWDQGRDNLLFTSVAPPVGTAYDTWMNAFPSLTGDDRLADADPDHDGTDNLLEFILNGDPTVSDSSILPQQSVSEGNLILSFHRRDDSESFSGLTLQYGTTLADWTDVAIGAVGGSSGGVSWTVAENDAEPDPIVVSIPMGTDAAKFARLKADTEP